jgi:hypothetical protein
MATAAECNAVLDAQGTGTKAKVVQSFALASTSLYYTLGGVDYPGRARWCTVTTADNAATQASAVQTAMAA